MASAGIPIKLLHEAEGHKVIVELQNGDVYRGSLQSSEDNMNCHLSKVIVRARTGETREMEHVYIRGSQVRFVILPGMLKEAPLFDRVRELKERSERPVARGAFSPILGRFYEFNVYFLSFLMLGIRRFAR